MWEAADDDLFATNAPGVSSGSRAVTGELTGDDLDQDRNLRPRTLGCSSRPRRAATSRSTT